MGEQSQPQAMKRDRGMGRIYRRGLTWWVQFRYRGRLFRESSGSERQSAAVKLLKRRLGEMGQGRLAGPDVERTTFDDLAKMLIDDYVVNGRKSLDRAERSIAHLRVVFDCYRAVEITADRVTSYIRDRLEVARPATIRLELAALGRMFTLGARAGKVASRPCFPSIEVRNTRSGFFTEAELRAVLAELPVHLRSVIEFLYLTGWRVGEARALTWRQVDFRAGTIRLEPHTTKNDDGRTFPFAAMPRLESLLRGQREHTSMLERAWERVIPTVFHWRGKPISNFHDSWHQARERAGLPGRRVHDLRRSAVRNMERAGVSRSVAMKLSGHKTESIYRRYAIVSEADLAEGVRKIAALQVGGGDSVRRVVPIADAATRE